MQYKRVQAILLKPANHADVIGLVNKLGSIRNVPATQLVAEVLLEVLSARIAEIKANVKGKPNLRTDAPSARAGQAGT